MSEQKRPKDLPDEILLSEQGGVFLKPSDCGSSVHWHVTLTKEFNWLWSEEAGCWKVHTHYEQGGRVGLNDCDRAIKWYVVGKDDVQKLTLAINELTKARSALKRALKLKPKEEDE